MVMSASMLGERVGLNGQEMNYILKEAGFLSGNPGEYDITEKAKPFVVEKDFHRGTGGYSIYNQYWTTRKWDESILDDLNLDQTNLSEVRNAVANDRRLKREAGLAVQDVVIPSVPELVAKEEKKTLKIEGKNLLIIGGVIVVAAATGYAIYKSIPHVKRWWKTKIKHETEEEQVNGKKKE